MPIALPIELRNRVVAAFNEGAGTLKELAERFSVSASSVFRWAQLDEHYSDLSARRQGGSRKLIIPDEDLDKLRALVSEKPDRTVKELAAEWSSRYMQPVGKAVMGRALLRAGLPFKKRLFGQLQEIARS